MTLMAEFWHGRLLRFVTAYGLAYVAIAWLTDAPFLIMVGNGVAMSVSAGVCVAYMPVLVGSLLSRVPTKGEHLGIGIFFASLSIFGMRALSFVARDLGYPGIYNTDWMTLMIALGILGGFFHLWAPNAVEGRIPRARWVSTGALVAIGLFITFMAWNAHTAIGAHPLVRLE